MGGSGSGLSAGDFWGGLSNFLNLAVEALKIVANALVELCKLFGLIEEKEDPEKLGDKMIQAEDAGIYRDDFSTDREYYEAIKNFDVDPEKSKQISQQDKLAHGSDLMANMINEKVPDFPLESAFTMFTHNEKYFTAEAGRAEEVIKISETDPEIFARIDDFMSGKEKDADVIEETLGTLVEIEKSINPDKAEDEIQNMLLDNVQK